MRTRERGIGNMPFIALIVLLVAAIGLFFMKSDEASTNLGKLQELRKQQDKSIATMQSAHDAYKAWLEIAGLGMPELESKEEGGSTVYPSPEVIKGKVSDWMMTQVGEIQQKSIAKVKARQYQVDKSSNVVRFQETGDTTAITLFGSPFVKETITFALFVAPLGEQFRYAAKAIEDNNKLFEDEYKSYQTRVAQLTTRGNESASSFQADIASKASLVDQEKTRADQTQDQNNQFSAKIDQLQSELQSVKTTTEKDKRKLELTIQAQKDRLTAEKKAMEIAMKEDPKDGEVLVADARQGLVFLNRGKNFRVAPNMKFKVWRIGKGNVREDVAEVEVIDVGDTSSTARVNKLYSSRVPVAAQMSFSSPFYDPFKKLRVYIYGNLRYYPSDLAKRRLAESGCTVAEQLDDTVNVVILGEPAVDIEAEAGSPEEVLANEEKAKAQRAARIREVKDIAATLGAVVVTEGVLQTFLEY